MKIKRTSGYSKDVAKMYIPGNTFTYSLSTDLSKQVKWIDGKPTDEVTGYQSWFIAEGTEPFKVKFTNRVELCLLKSNFKILKLVKSAITFTSKQTELR